MRELTQLEVDDVSGGTDAGDIGMAAAAGWTGTVAGAAIGGPGGALVGFLLGLTVSIGYTMATPAGATGIPGGMRGVSVGSTSCSIDDDSW